MNFSVRTPARLRKNRLSRLLRRFRSRGGEWIDLTESNPTRVGLSYPSRDILQALSSPSTLQYQPSPLGTKAARRAVASYYEERGYPVDPKDVVLTSSTSEAYSLIFKLMLNPGQAVAGAKPGYPVLDLLARSEGLHHRSFSLLFDGQWEPDWREFERLIEGEVGLLSLVHPNNPTGNYIKQYEWERIRHGCLRRGLAVVCDEVFFDYRVGERREPVFNPLEEREVPIFLYERT